MSRDSEIDHTTALCYKLHHSVIRQGKLATIRELSEESLKQKEDLCHELLELLDKLQAGDCRLKGLLLYELSCTLIEKRRRNLELQSDEENNNCFVDNVVCICFISLCRTALAQEALRCLQKTEEIFFGDVYEPPGLKKRLRALRGDCQQSISS
ncbi:unnamed protein product [Timema podura]|uniref:Uncharacterized protein n=1 Tax=Timema podura TaxID=61482 RepID=A0ABN7NV29_TIMPD|nr:unnamed protein product [Timema podura]